MLEFVLSSISRSWIIKINNMHSTAEGVLKEVLCLAFQTKAGFDK